MSVWKVEATVAMAGGQSERIEMAAEAYDLIAAADAVTERLKKADFKEIRIVNVTFMMLDGVVKA